MKFSEIKAVAKLKSYRIRNGRVVFRIPIKVKATRDFFSHVTRGVVISKGEIVFANSFYESGSISIVGFWWRWPINDFELVEE